jgi:hypothetical protein
MTVPAWALPDLLRALTVLPHEDDAARQAVARLLGVEIAAPAAKLAGGPPGGGQVKPPLPPSPPPPPGRDPGAERPPGQSQAPARPAWSGPSEAEMTAVLTPDYTESRRPPDWLETIGLFDEEAPGAPTVPEPLVPLLVPLWARGVLSGAVSTLSEAGPLDVERLVRGIARGAPWRRVPRQPWPTLARGALVLVDRSDALLPFAADQEWLVEQIRAVAGRDRLRVLDFEGCPSWGAGTGSQDEWEEDFESWRPPAGTPVMALTDLGIGARGYGARPVHPLEWSAFAERLRRAGCPLLAFVPYAPERWPAGLGRAFHILPWDRATSTRTVRRALGKALPGRGQL